MISRDPPELSLEATAALVRRWTTQLEGLELMRLQMPPGSTLADALAFHRALTQASRRPSKVMRGDADE